MFLSWWDSEGQRLQCCVCRLCVFVCFVSIGSWCILIVVQSMTVGEQNVSGLVCESTPCVTVWTHCLKKLLILCKRPSVPFPLTFMELWLWQRAIPSVALLSCVWGGAWKEQSIEAFFRGSDCTHVTIIHLINYFDISICRWAWINSTLHRRPNTTLYNRIQWLFNWACPKEVSQSVFLPIMQWSSVSSSQ